MEPSRVCIAAALNRVEDFRQELRRAPEAANAVDPQFGATPLHIAANRGSSEIVSLLLASPGVDTEVRDRNGLTPLYAAVGGGHLDVVRQLIAAKARAHVEDAEGLTPLHEAANNGSADLVRLLLAHGARAAHAAHSTGAAALHMAAVGGTGSEARVDWYQVLGLSRGASPRDISLAYRGLALKYHPDKQGAAPHTHVHTDADTQAPEEMFKRVAAAHEVLSDPARRAEYDNAYPNVIEALLRAGADKHVTTVAAAEGGDGETPAMLAVRCRQWDLAILLSDDIDARYRQGRTALHHALAFQDAYTVDAILRRRADVSISDDDGATALHVACGNGDATVVKAVLKAASARADAGAVDALQAAHTGDQRKTAAAAVGGGGGGGGAAPTHSGDGNDIGDGEAGQLVVQRLLAAKDTRGQAPLLLAVMGGDAEVVKVLVAAKADPLTADATGMTATEYAQEMGYDEVAELLSAASPAK